ncbi:MAG: hypothetical protein HDS07_09540 [Bacteroides sp.]|nr:hypothetical protein [Bacteroides sp.]
MALIKPIHLYQLLLASVVVLPVFLIERPDTPAPESTVFPPLTHVEMPAVYHWKTTFSIDSADHQFLLTHGIRRIYLRMFDVDDVAGEAIPIATTEIHSFYFPWKDDYEQLNSDSVYFVPTIYITLDALKLAKGREADLAEKIVERVKNMCSYHKYELTHIEALQLDCDWTSSTRESFFALCSATSKAIASKGLPWQLSSTIRLHQLRQSPPPVDYGVLMVYNTGSFSDPDASNSIINLADVEPYLKFLPSYPLHLDVAYPTYSWQLLFRNRQFIGLLEGVDTNDRERFAPAGANSFRALSDVPFRNIIIRRGDIIRCESSRFSEIAPIKALIEKRLARRPHSNILYHLDSKNLSTFTPNEIDSLLSVASAR